MLLWMKWTPKKQNFDDWDSTKSEDEACEEETLHDIIDVGAYEFHDCIYEADDERMSDEQNHSDWRKKDRGFVTGG